MCGVSFRRPWPGYTEGIVRSLGGGRRADLWGLVSEVVSYGLQRAHFPIRLKSFQPGTESIPSLRLKVRDNVSVFIQIKYGEISSSIYDNAILAQAFILPQ